MKTQLLSPIWLGSVFLFLLHQFLQKYLLINISFIDNWLDPFLSMPILLGLILLERRIFFKGKRDYSFSLLETIVAVIFFAFVFEFLFPKYLEGFTRDKLDIIAYGLGGILFYITQPSQNKV